MSEAEPPTSGASHPDRNDLQRVGREPETRYEDLYKVAYEESRRTLDDQADELNRIRDRAVQFEVFIGAATAFLVGTGLQAPHRDTTFRILAGVATAASVMMILFL